MTQDTVGVRPDEMPVDMLVKFMMMVMGIT